MRVNNVLNFCRKSYYLRNSQWRFCCILHPNIFPFPLCKRFQSDIPGNFYVPPSLIPPPPPLPVPVDTASSLAEPALSSLGLCNYTPAGGVQALLEYFHISLGLPWLGAIIFVTILLRCTILPLVIKSQKQISLMGKDFPEMAALQARMTKARENNDFIGVQQLMADMVNLQQKIGPNSLKAFYLAFAQGAVFSSVFFGLRGMVSVPVESMKSGGLLWFTDLTIPDPCYVLPCVIASTLFVIMSAGSSDMGVGMPMQPFFIQRMKWILPPLIGAIVIFMPSAMQMYWVVGNFISLLTTIALQNERIQKKLGIDFTPPSGQEEFQQKGFTQGFRESIENAKYVLDQHKRSESHGWLQKELELKAKKKEGRVHVDPVEQVREMDGKRSEKTSNDGHQQDQFDGWVEPTPAKAEVVEIVDSPPTKEPTSPPAPTPPTTPPFGAFNFMDQALLKQVKNIVDDKSQEEMLLKSLKETLTNPDRLRELEESYKPFFPDERQRKMMVEMMRQMASSPTGQKLFLQQLRTGLANPTQFQNMVRKQMDSAKSKK